MNSSIKNKGRSDKDIVKEYKFGNEVVAIHKRETHRSTAAHAAISPIAIGET